MFVVFLVYDSFKLRTGHFGRYAQEFPVVAALKEVESGGSIRLLQPDEGFPRSSLSHDCALLSFNGGISTWDVSGVLDVDWIFHNAVSFLQDLSDWAAKPALTGMMLQGNPFKP